MNLPAFPRNWFRHKAASARPARLPSGIEPLEARIAPATLISATQISFLDKNGDIATVTISKPLFTAANVNNVFTFDTGSVNGDNTAQQQLELFNVQKLGPGAAMMDITISATGAVDVGYINSGGIDLGNVTVGGDLGRIHAGLAGTGHPALVSLTVNSLGADGISTQAPGGNLETLISGPVTTLTVNGDIDQASIGVGGHSLGSIGTLTITGSLNGGALPFSGSIRTQGGLGTVVIDGSINGGAGANSGLIGTAGQIQSVTVDGSIIGGGGMFSGAVLATGSITYAQVNGTVTGGTGADSGEIGTANMLETVVVESSVLGGDGALSGVILAARSIGSANVSFGLVGGSGANSGVIGAGVNINSLTIGQYGLPVPIVSGPKPQAFAYEGIQSGSGSFSGAVHAGGNIGTVTIGGYIEGNYTTEEGANLRPGIHPLVGQGNGTFYGDGDGSGVVSAGGGITSVKVTENVLDGGIVSGSNLGTVTIDGSMTEGSGVDAHSGIGTVSINSGISNDYVSGTAHPQSLFTQGMVDSAILLDNGTIGEIIVYGDGVPAIESCTIATSGSIGLIRAIGSNSNGSGIAYSDIYASSLTGVDASSVNSTAIDSSTFVVTNGIGSIQANSEGGGYGILDSNFQAGANIGPITASSFSELGAIVGSGFNAGGNIGNINATGAISQSTFVAGINLGSAFNVSTTGTFTNTDAASIGFGSSKSTLPASIGTITVIEGTEGSAVIENSTFLAGVHGSGPDKQFGTKDDAVPAASSIGAISAVDGLNTNFFESGTIGAATTSGPVVATTYLATDSV